MSRIMIQGTGSDTGKSALVTGLCRVLQRKGFLVAPFKPQNMALNSAVTQDGGEIGRAQAVQAAACGLEPHTDMNPVLIKPNSDTAAQIIVHGVAASTMEAKDYFSERAGLMPKVLESWDRQRQQYSHIIVEGAGSPAEINLRKNDIANMGFAEAANCPVILISDIDKGGVFAQIVGTMELLSESERRLVKGFVINKFRGDINLLKGGLDWLEKKTQKPVFGVLPYLHNLHLEAEDGFSGLQNNLQPEQDHLRVIVPVLPRISNHTDFDALTLRTDVDFKYIRQGQAIPASDLIILPGSKSVRADLHWLKEQGWEAQIQRHLRYGGRVIGICGGYQMLGTTINDPLGVEGNAGSSQGLGLLDMTTDLQEQKRLTKVEGELLLTGTHCHGYEIHTGVSRGPALQRPAIQLDGATDGAVSEDKQILGTYLHGLFDHPDTCNAILQWAGLKQPVEFDVRQVREQGIDRMADLCAEHLDIKAILRSAEG